MTQKPKPSAFAQFVAELNRRHVFRVLLGYAAAAFLVLQLAEIVFPAFGLGATAVRALVILAALGFPPAAVLAWVFDITPRGIERTADAGSDPMLPRVAILLVTLVVTSGVGVWLYRSGAFVVPGEDNASIELAEFDPSAPIRSIAVLPLADFSQDESQAYFTLGIQEEITAKLSMVEGLRVVSRTSVARFAETTLSSPEIGRELGVDALVEGSVRVFGDSARVILQIIDAASDSHITTLEFTRDLTNVLGVQAEVAHAVVHAVSADHSETEFTEVAMTAAPEAQQAYLKGRYEVERGTEEGFQRAFEHFQQAMAADPDFAPAWSGMASARFLRDMSDGEMDPLELERAREEARQALDRGDASAETREVYTLIDRSLPDAAGAVVSEAELGQMVHVFTIPGTGDSVVIDLKGMDTTWVGAITGLGHRMEEVMVRAAVRREGDGSDRMFASARQMAGAGLFEEATQLAGEVVAANPAYGPAWSLLARMHSSHGDIPGAVDVYRRWSETGTAGAPDPDEVTALESALSEGGEDAFWRWQIDRLNADAGAGRPVSHVEYATAYAALGQADPAMEHLMRAAQTTERGLFTLESDPIWDTLRTDPRFTELVRQTRTLRFSRPTRQIPPLPERVRR